MKKALITFLAISLLIAGLWYLFVGKKALRAQRFSPTQLVHCCHHDQIVPSSDAITQRWTYLGKGRHSCAFESEDGLYVIKFFRENPRNSQWLVNIIPDIPLLSEWRWKKQRCAVETVIQGYRDAYTLDAAGCGIVYGHFSPSTDLQNITLIGEKGEMFDVDINPLAFVIQHKATELREVLKKHLIDNDLIKAKQAIHKIVTLYQDQYNKGMVDWGIGIMHNSGFAGNQAIHFDVSKLMLDNSMKNSHNQEKDFNRSIKRIHLWMNQHFPGHTQEIIEYTKSLFTDKI